MPRSGLDGARIMTAAGLVTFAVIAGVISAVFGVALAPGRVERTKEFINQIFE